MEDAAIEQGRQRSHRPRGHGGRSGERHPFPKARPVTRQRDGGHVHDVAMGLHHTFGAVRRAGSVEDRRVALGIDPCRQKFNFSQKLNFLRLGQLLQCEPVAGQRHRQVAIRRVREQQTRLAVLEDGGDVILGIGGIQGHEGLPGLEDAEHGHGRSNPRAEQEGDRLRPRPQAPDQGVRQGIRRLVQGPIADRAIALYDGRLMRPGVGLLLETGVNRIGVCGLRHGELRTADCGLRNGSPVLLGLQGLGCVFDE
jgi:hypothetical protein